MLVSNFEEKIEKSLEKARAYILSRYKIPKADAEDILQESALKAFKSADSFLEKCSFETWFISICKNEINAFFKKKKKDNILLPIQDLKDQDSFEPFLKDQSLEEKDQSSKISEYEFLFSESLQKLSDNHKQVIELFLKNASQQEISNILNIPISSARTRLFYAKEKLKKIIKHHAYKSNIQLPYY